MRQLLFICFLLVTVGCASQGASGITMGTGTDNGKISGETDTFQPGEPIWVGTAGNSDLGESIELQVVLQESDDVVHRGVIDVKPDEKQGLHELPVMLVAGSYTLQLTAGDEQTAKKSFTVKTGDIPDYEVNQEVDREENIIDLLVVTSASTAVELAAILHDLQATREDADVLWVQFHEPAEGSYGSLKATGAIAKSEEGAIRIGTSHPNQFLLELK